MKLNLPYFRPVSLIALAVFCTSPVRAQGGARSGGPAPAPAGVVGAVTRGRGAGPGAMFAIPNLSPEQSAALLAMQAKLEPLTTAVTDARAELMVASLQAPATVRGIVEKIGNAELALANARVEEFQKLQASPEALNPDQSKAYVLALRNPAVAAYGMAVGAPRGRSGAPMPVAAP